MEANREAAEEVAQRAQEADRRGDLAQALHLIQRANTMYPSSEHDRLLRDIRMRYARERDERNARAPRDDPQSSAQRRGFVIPMFPMLRRVTGQIVGPQRVDAFIGMVIGIIFLLIARWFANGRPLIEYLGRLPGDIYMSGSNFSFSFPFATCFLVSMLLNWILPLLRGPPSTPPSSSSSQQPPPHPRSQPSSFAFPGPGVSFQSGGSAQGGASFQGGIYFCAVQ